MTLYYYEYFNEMGYMYNTVLEYNLLIKPRVQLYLYSDVKYN